MPHCVRDRHSLTLYRRSFDPGSTDEPDERHLPAPPAMGFCHVFTFQADGRRVLPVSVRSGHPAVLWSGRAWDVRPLACSRGHPTQGEANAHGQTVRIPRRAGRGTAKMR